LDASIGGNVDLTAESAYLGSKTDIKGNLNYTSNKKLSLDPEAIVSGKTIQKSLPKQMPKPGWSEIASQIRLGRKENWLVSLIKSVLINLIIGLILAFFFKDRLTKTSDYIMATGNRVRSMGVGLLLLFLTPALIVILAITIIGIPLAVLLVIAYGSAIAVSRIVTAMAIGRRLTAQYWIAQKDSLMAATLLGVVACWIVFAIPWVGKVFSLIGILWGLGGAYYFFRPAIKKGK
jgi:hypothetical protein